MNIEVIKSTFNMAVKNERHHNNAETRYWCDQYRLLAKLAIQQLEKQDQEPVEWGVDWGKAGDTPCVSIIKRKSGGGIEVMAVEYAPPQDEIEIDTWNGLTDKQKLVLIKYAPDWTTLLLIEEVETTLRINNNG